MMKEVIKFAIALFIFVMVFMVMLGTFMNYSTYLSLKGDGYKVKFSILNGCEVLLRNQDNSVSWEQCQAVGNKYTLKNWGIKE